MEIRKVAGLSIVSLLVTCFTIQGATNIELVNSEYRIKRIKSVGNFYVIYAKKEIEPTIEFVYEKSSLQNDKEELTKNWAYEWLIDKEKYRIIKIETTDSQYVVYVQNKALVKIVSKKIHTQRNSTKIRKGKVYNLTLRSMIEEQAKANILTMNYLDVPCRYFDEKTTICFEIKKGIYDLHFSDNLEGLCLKNQ